MNPTQNNPKKFLRTFFLGGLLPVIAFTVIEEKYGTLWGIIAGMIFGVGEIIWELLTTRRVDPITWAGNGMLLVLGTVSLIAKEGIWFKMQPAIMEAAIAIALIVSVILKKPALIAMAQKQGQVIHPQMHGAFAGLTFRIGIFFAAHAALATWAALKWSTTAWAFLKGIGFTLSMVLYMAGEGFYLRHKAKKAPQAQMNG